MSVIMSSVLIEGYSLDELLALKTDDIQLFLPDREVTLFHIGSAQILGRVHLDNLRLVIELAQIEGGGEGVLPTLWVLANRFASQNRLREVEWIVHAVYCSKPNLKLRRMLERRNFVIEEIDGIGSAYHLIHALPNLEAPA